MMVRERDILEMGYLLTGGCMELAISGNHPFSDSNSSLLSSTQKAELSVDSGTKVLSLVIRASCSTQLQGLLPQMILG